MKYILAIDPGNVQSAYCLIDEEYRIIEAAKAPNIEVQQAIDRIAQNDDVEVVIEKVACYGMPVGKEVFDTCEWIGRFAEQLHNYWPGYEAKYIYRQEEKKLICHSMTAADSNIRRALIDRFAKFDFKNGKGTKKEPDFFYGFKADMWAAFAVGVTYLDKLKIRNYEAVSGNGDNS